MPENTFDAEMNSGAGRRARRLSREICFALGLTAAALLAGTIGSAQREPEVTAAVTGKEPLGELPSNPQ